MWYNLTQSAHVTVINGRSCPAMKTAHFIGFRLSTLTPPSKSHYITCLQYGARSVSETLFSFV